MRHRALRGLCAAVALALAVSPLIPIAPVAAQPSPQTIPLDMVIAVDESGSLSANDVAREMAATSTIAQSVLNPNSRVTVLGFGSNNGLPHQSAVDVVCRPTIVNNSVNIQYLATCVKGLHRRTDSEGNDTDHVAALAQSLSTLSSNSPPNALKVIFMLTDGQLDVHRSPSYGSGSSDDPQIGQRRNEAAKAQLTTMIGQAQQAGVQIWPLGFGAEVTQANLDQFAAGGSRQGCDNRSISQPTAQIVHDSSDVTRSLFEAYALATCSGLGQTRPEPLAAGETRDLTINIPVIATDGTITVSKGDPNVRVDFIDPKHRMVPTSGSLDDSSFTRSGMGTSIEALRIVNPLNGPWTIRLTAPKTMTKQLVSATAIWQGAVQATIVPEPPVARPGQKVTIKLSLVTRRGAITDEGTLRGLTFSVTATDTTPPLHQVIAVRDDGKAPDNVAHDGSFAGTFTAPEQAGNVSLVGVVSGPALRSEQVPINVEVTAQGPAVQGDIGFSGGATVHPGNVVHGKLTTQNGTNTSKQVRLVLEGTPDANATVSPSTPFDLAPGDSAKGFTVTFAKNARIGGASLTLKLVDAATPSTVYANAPLTVTVKKPPTVWDRIRPYVTGAVILLILLMLALWRRRRVWKDKVKVRGLHVSLTLNGERAGSELSAPSRWTRDFRFVIRETDGPDPRPLAPQPGGDDPVYVAQRKGDSGVVLRTPGGDPVDLAFGVESDPLPSGHRITFTDTRRRRPARRHSWWSRLLKPRPRPKPVADPTHQEPDDEPELKSSAAYDDPWF